MKIIEFFNRSDRNCTKQDTDVYLFYRLLQKIPQNWTDIDGNVVDMDFLTSENWKTLEREYFHNYSPDKESSVLLDEIARDPSFSSDVVYKEEIQNLVNDIWNKFGEGWCRAWYALAIKYRPLDNYDGKEETSYNNFEKERTSDRWDTDKVDETDNSIRNDVYGFNQPTTETPTNANEGNVSPKNTLVGRFTQPTNVHEITEGSNHDVEKQKGSIEINKHGNLGVTTSQQMLASELDFRKDYNFVNLMFNNIDDILTCKTYGGDI